MQWTGQVSFSQCSSIFLLKHTYAVLLVYVVEVDRMYFPCFLLVHHTHVHCKKTPFEHSVLHMPVSSTHYITDHVAAIIYKFCNTFLFYVW